MIAGCLFAMVSVNERRRKQKTEKKEMSRCRRTDRKHEHVEAANPVLSVSHELLISKCASTVLRNPPITTKSTASTAASTRQTQTRVHQQTNAADHKTKTKHFFSFLFIFTLLTN